ncbi:MAG: J domain-containing protein [cyanobacterium endosymbiont of Rhopalodia musculus]|uniref:J domain-containing protein n=1 Tax=cyanobacterium endosymbiont of Epithemia clementina EcSB TaxID=3034674 RepID=UPI00248135ED|nr:J domain-containing protein [cyanobacterium endosymbiont of Epithemia clementina EcSB]WGT68223.1 J domain-containing protein [cyanobacterium endosymbiont of Epithemia clementina EcSB]
MTQQPTTPQSTYRKIPILTKFANSYYTFLGLYPSASAVEIRRAYRELSKRYHPDTTDLSPEVAIKQFQKLNEAYRTLSNPEERSLYDLKIGYSHRNMIQTLDESPQQKASGTSPWPNTTYFDSSNRPLSTGEIFVLFILGLTFVGCMLLAITISIFRGNTIFSPTAVLT